MGIYIFNSLNGIEYGEEIDFVNGGKSPYRTLQKHRPFRLIDYIELVVISKLQLVY